MQVDRSDYIAQNKPQFQKLLKLLSEKFAYVSILAADPKEKIYAVSASGISISDRNDFGKRGFVVRVHDGKNYAEYSASQISEETIPVIAEKITSSLQPMKEGFDLLSVPAPEDEPVTFIKNTEYEIRPDELGDEKIVETLSSLRERTLSMDERLLDCRVNLSTQTYHKLFLSDQKDLEQNVLWTCAGIAVMAARGEEIKDAYKACSCLGGAEVLDQLEKFIPDLVKTVTDLLESEPMIPGEYECICSPETTGMIVHEAFGHGVEMDMFVKDRALAKNFMGQRVASDLVTMRDGAAAAKEVATYFFDDEGTLAQDTLVIDKGILVSGYADALSAACLGVKATGNGRRESVERKAYTRMTNTFFEGGQDSLEDMIKSVPYGMLLEQPSSGMEDPKNWGIQCMVTFAREIKDGKLTGRIFSPVVLTGYVPDLLKSISMMTPVVELGGSGACGKGYKEWVKVSDGGPWIKAKIRLG